MISFVQIKYNSLFIYDENRHPTVIGIGSGELEGYTSTTVTVKFKAEKIVRVYDEAGKLLNTFYGVN